MQIVRNESGSIYVDLTAHEGTGAYFTSEAWGILCNKIILAHEVQCAETDQSQPCDVCHEITLYSLSKRDDGTLIICTRCGATQTVEIVTPPAD